MLTVSANYSSTTQACTPPHESSFSEIKKIILRVSAAKVTRVYYFIQESFYKYFILIGKSSLVALKSDSNCMLSPICLRYDVIDRTNDLKNKNLRYIKCLTESGNVPSSVFEILRKILRLSLVRLSYELKTI